MASAVDALFIFNQLLLDRTPFDFSNSYQLKINNIEILDQEMQQRCSGQKWSSTRNIHAVDNVPHRRYLYKT